MSITCKKDDLNTAIVQMNNNISALKEWSEQKSLLLNLNKTQAMLIGHPRILNNINKEELLPLSHGNVKIKYSSSVKNLGMVIDEHLTLKAHVAKIVSNTNGIFYQLYRFRHVTTRELRLKLVHTLILSKLDYCLVATMGISNELNIKLQRIMNRCVRYVIGVPRSSHITLYRRSLNWLSLSDRRLLYALSLLFSIIKNHEPQYLKELFIETLPGRALRGNQRRMLLKIPFVCTDQFKFSFAIQTARIWNSLAEDIINIESPVIFKRRVFEMLYEGEQVQRST